MKHYEDLNDRLRTATKLPLLQALCNEAADAIEELLARLEAYDGCPLVEIPPHGRLIDADEFLNRAIGTKCFRGDYALMLEELVGESTTILEAEGGET